MRFEQLQDLLPSVIDQCRVVAIGVYHHRDTQFPNGIEILDVGIDLPSFDPVLGVYLDDIAFILSQFQAVHQGVPIPAGRHVETLVVLPVHVDLVHVAYDVDAARLDHAPE